jgi:guanylate kinase
MDKKNTKPLQGINSENQHHGELEAAKDPMIPSKDTTFMEFKVLDMVAQAKINSEFWEGVKNCDVTQVTSALEKEACVNVRNKASTSRPTGLMWAASTSMMCIDQLKMVRLLLEKKSDINAVDQYGQDALMEAVDCECKDVVKLLLDSKAKVNTVTPITKDSALKKAIFRGSRDLVQQLLQQKDIEPDLIKSARAYVLNLQSLPGRCKCYDLFFKTKVILCGKAASGKSFAKEHLVKDHKFIADISLTTRPTRDDEQDGVHYSFVSKTKFEKEIESKNLFEYTLFNGWYYGTLRESWDKCNLFIMTPSTLRAMQKEDRLKCIVIYLDIDHETRQQRLKTRNDKQDSIDRRLKADDEQFAKFSDFEVRVTDPFFKVTALVELLVSK